MNINLASIIKIADKIANESKWLNTIFKFENLEEENPLVISFWASESKIINLKYKSKQ